MVRTSDQEIALASLAKDHRTGAGSEACPGRVDKARLRGEQLTMSWNLILQANYPSSPRPSLCLMGTVPGLAQPAQIHLVSCDSTTDAVVGHLLRWIEGHLGQPFTRDCSGPATSGRWDGGLGCQAFHEPACRHVLVFFKGIGIALGADTEALLHGWTSRAGANSEVIVVLPSGEGGQHLPGSLRHYHWLTHPAPESELALPILQAAGIGARRRLFLSYRRQDTRALADQILEALVRQGFQVYVDRFSWMPGRLFPAEIAEELADKGVMLLLESIGLHHSRWTQWELAFARTYNLGIVAVNVDGAPWQRGIHPSDRLGVTPALSGELSGTELDVAIRFILRRYNLAELRRRVFFEGAVRRAAAAAGGSVAVRGDGLFEVSGPGHRALVLPSGRPGNLADLCQMGRASLPTTSGQHRVLAGQHENLPPRARQDLGWLANEAQVTLCSTLGLFRSIQNLIQRGRP